MATSICVLRPTGPTLDEPVLRGDRGDEDAEELGERDGDGGDGAGLDDGEEGPAVEEAGQRAEGFAQVDVLAAGLGHGGGEFAVAERGDQGEDGGDEPDEHQQAGRIAPAARCRRRR